MAWCGRGPRQGEGRGGEIRQILRGHEIAQADGELSQQLLRAEGIADKNRHGHGEVRIVGPGGRLSTQFLGKKNVSLIRRHQPDRMVSVIESVQVKQNHVGLTAAFPLRCEGIVRTLENEMDDQVISRIKTKAIDRNGALGGALLMPRPVQIRLNTEPGMEVAPDR